MQPSTFLPAGQGLLSMQQFGNSRTLGEGRAATCPSLLLLCGPRATREGASCMAARFGVTHNRTCESFRVSPLILGRRYTHHWLHQPPCSTDATYSCASTRSVRLGSHQDTTETLAPAQRVTPAGMPKVHLGHIGAPSLGLGLGVRADEQAWSNRARIRADPVTLNPGFRTTELPGTCVVQDLPLPLPS